MVLGTEWFDPPGGGLVSEVTPIAPNSLQCSETAATAGALPGQLTEIPAPPRHGGEGRAFPDGRKGKHRSQCFLLPHLPCIPRIRAIRTGEDLGTPA